MRGWPKVTSAFEYIARLNEFDQAHVRAAIRRVAAAIALERDAAMTFGDYDRDDEEVQRDLVDVRIEGAGEYTDESVKPYQEMEAHAGDILTLDPGYKPTRIDTGAPSAQDAEIAGSFESRICMALGMSVPTLTGDYKAVSYSGGQLGLIKERATSEDIQHIARRQIIRRVHLDWLMDEWVATLTKYPRLRPGDFSIFAAPDHVLPKMPVLEKGKILAAVEKAVKAGLITFPEARAEAGFATDDIEAIIDEIREQREMLGEAGGDGDAPVAEQDDDGGERDGEERDDDDE